MKKTMATLLAPPCCFFVLGLWLMASSASAAVIVQAQPSATEAKPLPMRALGRADAPLVITAYSSLTCSHCADFFNTILPEVEKRYINTGKVRIVYHDFAMNGVDLKGAALAHCLPEAQFFPYIRAVYGNQMNWLRSEKPDAVLTQYAQMAGLAADKAKSCVEDSALLDSIVAERTKAIDSLEVKATPTFIFEDGSETRLVGTRSIDDFSSAVDQSLAKKK